MPAYDDSRFAPPAPLAKVTLRHSAMRNTLSDVPMLIDSGADVTLIPMPSATRLGVAASSEERYELMGFDGTTSLAHAVHLDLLFLRRAFKGRFLLIDQQWGILGRDILNHVPILLHGPQLTWSEQLATDKADNGSS